MPFHYAFPVTNLEDTRSFYGQILGCKEGRAAERWVDFDFFGHQISAHLFDKKTDEQTNLVDGDAVPIPHFGVIVSFTEFDELAKRLQAHGVRFRIPPRTRFSGKIGEQRTMFFHDPSGNALEIKAFADADGIFKADLDSQF